jgi:hypothetical protein
MATVREASPRPLIILPSMLNDIFSPPLTEKGCPS